MTDPNVWRDFMAETRESHRELQVALTELTKEVTRLTTVQAPLANATERLARLEVEVVGVARSLEEERELNHHRITWAVGVLTFAVPAMTWAVDLILRFLRR